MERIGRYQITRELGRGSMSIVYEGFDDRIDRHLAIKVLRQDFARDMTSRQHFLREARAGGRLGHPNIVTVFDVGHADGLPYMVMELLSGDTLADHIGTSPATVLPLDTMLDVAIQLAAALDYAHEHGIIHRDIKPPNIHFDPDSRRIKLMDFGIAAIDPQAGTSGAGHGVLGTPHYMPPEQLSGEPLDRRSDLYSLGVVLYQLLGGYLPFQGDTVAEVAGAISTQAAQPLRPLHAETPRALTDLVRRLMHGDPAVRPASARQVHEELEDIRAGMRRGILQAVRRQSMLWRWPLAIGTGMALVLALGLSYVYQRQTEAMTQTVYGYGDALASIIAQETAEALILDDTTALGILVADFSANPQVEYLHISDAADMVAASTNPFLQGQRRPVTAGQPVARGTDSIRLLATEGGALEFQAPVRFQARRVGELQLGLDASTLHGIATATLWMLALVFALTLLTALIGLAWMARRHRRAIEHLAWALKRLRGGQTGIRLDGESHHEYTPAYKQFNRLAVALDERALGTAGHTPPRAPGQAMALDEAAADQTLDLRNR